MKESLHSQIGHTETRMERPPCQDHFLIGDFFLYTTGIHADRTCLKTPPDSNDYFFLDVHEGC